MHVTVLRMLSTSSLQAFSGAATTAPIGRAAAPGAVRLANGPNDAAKRPDPASSTAVPDIRPGTVPPRGSLLNLAV